MPDYSVPPHMSLLHFNLLSPCWSSEKVSLSKTVHGPCKTPGTPGAGFSTGFYSWKLWEPMFLAREPWAGESSVELGPLTPEISLYTCLGDQPVLSLCPSFQS